jgi:two-component system cell cycle sensor histidine kinase/response regulator CckA
LELGTNNSWGLRNFLSGNSLWKLVHSASPEQIFLLMSTKKAAIVVSASMLVLHFCVLGLVRPESQRVLLSNLLQIACGWLACGFAFRTAARSREHMRIFWALIGSSFFMWGLGQAGWTYFEVLFGAHQVNNAPTDLFFFFSFTPMLLALLLRKEFQGSGRDWARMLDAAQVGILAISGYLFFFALPPEAKVSQEFTDRLLTYVFTSRNIFIGVLFLLRSAFAANRNGRRLYGWLALFWIFYSSMTGITNYARLHFGAQTGSWWDLGWTTPFLFGAVIAGNWEEFPGPPAFDTPRPKGLKSMVSGYFFPTIVPLAIVLMAGQVTSSHFYLAYGAILSSFICYSARLAVTQHRLTVSAEELGTAEARFQLLFAQGPQPIWVFDRRTYQILEVNSAAERDYGYSRDEFLNMKVTDLRLPEDVPEFIEIFQSGAPGNFFRARHRRKGGKLMSVQITSQQIEFAGREAEIEIAQDISEKLALEDKLRQSQKMEAVGTLAGGVAHDFNNLLTVITGYSKLLGERFASDEQARKNLEQITRASERAAGLTRQLLAFSRRQVLQPTKLDVNRVISSFVAKTDPAFRGHGIRLGTRLSEVPVTVKADAGQIEEVIMNLVQNAADAMPQGGEIEIQAELVRIDSEKAASLEVKPGQYAALTVKDSGAGMSQETLSRVFEPFFSTKSDKASGLGLSTVYGIVRQSEGAVEGESEVGTGSSFRVYLPLVDSDTAKARGAGVLEGNAGSETILLVEDDADLRDLSRRVLTMNGYRVLAAAHGREALRVAEEHPDKIELMLTDVIMPGMSGREVAETLQSARPKMKVLYVSGYTDNIIAERGMLAPGMAFLQKPFSPSNLVAKVREVLDAPEKHRAAPA